jgi:hypothetical protein
MFFVLIGFIYDSIDTTISYLKYETVFGLKSNHQKHRLFRFASILLKSFCVSRKSIQKIYQSMHYFIVKLIAKHNTVKNQSLKNVEKILKLPKVTPYAHRCITFFSQLNSSKYSDSLNFRIPVNTHVIRTLYFGSHEKIEI